MTTLRPILPATFAGACLCASVTLVACGGDEEIAATAAAASTTSTSEGPTGSTGAESAESAHIDIATGDATGSAWTNLAGCDSFDDSVLDVVRDYRDQFRGKGPEQIRFQG